MNVWIKVLIFLKKTKCLTSPTLPAKVEKHIKFCQDEVKTNIIEDVLLASSDDHPPYEHDPQVYGLHDFQLQEDEHEYEYEHEHETHDHNPQYQHPSEHPKYAQEVTHFDQKFISHDHNIPQYEPKHTLKDDDYKWHRSTHHRRSKRGVNINRSEYHPTIVSHEDKWVAGVRN